MRHTFLAAAFVLLGATGAQATQLDIAILADPQSLDPALSGSAVDRNVLAALCDKLIDTDNDLHPVPDLATSWEWSADGLTLTLHLRAGVKFQDGTDFDAAAVKINIERQKTLPTGLHKPELRPVTDVEVVDSATVRLHLSQPNAPLIAFLADRAGMMLSPKNIAERGERVNDHPVCSGPFSFVQRVAQDRIVLDRFPGYWNAKAISIDRVVYHPIPDSQVRLANLQSGQMQIIDQMPPADVEAVQGKASVVVVRHSAAAFHYLLFNVNNGPRAQSAFGRDPRVRKAFEMALDRRVLNEVAFGGYYVPNNQTEVPGSAFYDPAAAVPARDVEGAKALLKQAGVDRVKMVMQLGQAPLDAQIGEIVQAMVQEAGFDVSLQAIENNAANTADKAGDFDFARLTWSGRADPDANLSIVVGCDGSFNYGKYCSPEMESLLKSGRETIDPDKRKAIYRQIGARYRADVPWLVLYNLTYLWGLSPNVQGFMPNEDGLIRLQGVSLKP